MESAQRIHYEVASGKFDRLLWRHRSFGDEITWIDHLRIAEPAARIAPALRAKMHAPHIVAADTAATCSDTRAEIGVLLPAIEHQSLVEAQIGDGRTSEGHIAAVGREIVLDGAEHFPRRRVRLFHD